MVHYISGFQTANSCTQRRNPWYITPKPPRLLVSKSNISLGVLTCPILQNMRCETFTYSAHETDYSVSGVSAPSRLGRSETSSAEELSRGSLSASPISIAMFKFWMWMQWHLSGALETLTAPKYVTAGPSHIWTVPSANPNAQVRAVRVNRSIMRKLRRLQRLHPPSYFDGPAYRPRGTREDLSENQYLEYMIRKHKWSRVRIYGLGLTRADLMQRSISLLCLQGNGTHFAMSAMCNAPISPD